MWCDLQIATIVQQVVRQGSTDALIEAWASPDAPESSIEDAVSEVNKSRRRSTQLQTMGSQIGSFSHSLKDISSLATEQSASSSVERASYSISLV